MNNDTDLASVEGGNYKFTTVPRLVGKGGGGILVNDSSMSIALAALGLSVLGVVAFLLGLSVLGVVAFIRRRRNNDL